MPTNFEKLKLKWDKKLADSGFEDIENADGSLKVEVHPRTLNNAIRDNRASYYDTAQNFLNNCKFTTLLDYSIWKMHTEGMSFRDIAEEMGLTFYKVRTIVIKLQKQSGLKK